MMGRIGIDLAIGLGLRGLGAISGFALLWLIAQTSGSEAVGAYQMGLTTATVLALMALAGQDILVIRQAPHVVRTGSLADLSAHYFAGRKWIARSAAAAALIMAAAAIAIATFFFPDNRWNLTIVGFFPAVILLALLRHSNALLRSQGSILISQSLEGVFYTTIAAGIIAIFWLNGWELFPLALPISYLTGLVIAVGISLLFSQCLTRSWQGAATQDGARIDVATGLRVTGAPILMMGGEWLTLVALGALAGLSEAGVYRTAFMICMLFQLINASFATMAGPHLSRANAAGDRTAVMDITWKVGLIGFALAVPLALVCVLLPDLLLGLFGKNFLEGALTLQVLASAQTVNVIFGPVGTALIMVGRERQVLAIEVVASFLAVILASLLIPYIGMLGAAIGFATATILRNTASRIALNAWRPDTASLRA